MVCLTCSRPRNLCIGVRRSGCHAGPGSCHSGRRQHANDDRRIQSSENWYIGDYIGRREWRGVVKYWLWFQFRFRFWLKFQW